MDENKKSNLDLAYDFLLEQEMHYFDSFIKKKLEEKASESEIAGLKEDFGRYITLYGELSLKCKENHGFCVFDMVREKLPENKWVLELERQTERPLSESKLIKSLDSLGHAYYTCKEKREISS